MSIEFDFPLAPEIARNVAAALAEDIGADRYRQDAAVAVEAAKAFMTMKKK